MEKKFDLKEQIDIMVEYYKTHKRGMSDNGVGCCYINSEGGKCGIGRMMTEESLKFLADNSLNKRAVENVIGNENVDFLPEFEGMELKMMEVLQRIHDADSNWIETDEGYELTAHGRLDVQDRIKNYYSINTLTEF